MLPFFFVGENCTLQIQFSLHHTNIFIVTETVNFLLCNTIIPLMQDNLQDLQPTIEETQPQNTDLQPTTTESEPQNTTETENVKTLQPTTTENEPIKTSETKFLDPSQVLLPIEDSRNIIIKEQTEPTKANKPTQTTTKQPFAITLKFFGESATHIESIINEGIKHGCWSNKTQFAEQCLDFAINHNLAKQTIGKGFQLLFPYPDGLHGSNHIPNKLLKNSRYKEILKNIPQL